jgi:hypothetical protein
MLMTPANQPVSIHKLVKTERRRNEMLAQAMIGNWVAIVAILAWPGIAVAFFRTRPPVEATVWTILGALLLLPSGFSIKLAMIPAIDKNSVPNVCVFFACLFLVRSRRGRGRAFGPVGLLALLLIGGPVITSVLNNDTIAIGERVLPGVGYYDGISALLSQVLIFLPFLVGRRIFQSPEDTEVTIRCLAIAGLLYSLPMLLELRLSPQLSKWIYGFFPSAFDTEFRYGSYRPIVFMQNGLALAFFMMTAFVSAVAIRRTNNRVLSLPRGAPTIYLGLIVVLCKSAGALIYSLFAGFAVGCIKPKTQLRLALIFACIGLSYPLLRVIDWFPDKILVQAAASISEQRAQSLQVRFDQERKLLDRASERFFFGWGRYGRNRVYDEWGNDTSITDGEWIETIGSFGLVGFLAEFGLLAWPVLRASMAFKFVRTERDRIFLSTLALLVSLGIIEQLPNSSVSSWSWLLAGSLLGRADRLKQRTGQAKTSARAIRMPETSPGGYKAPTFAQK